MYREETSMRQILNEVKRSQSLSKSKSGDKYLIVL